MKTSAHPGSTLRFGRFELDLGRGELRKEGRRIRLQEQPFQILQRLLESPGQVVTRDEIRKRLWPDDTVVEFDHSINVAVKRLRDALRDSAEKPRYIETVARRGYRFIGEVDVMDPALPAPAALPPQIPAGPPPRWSDRRSLILVALIAVVLITWTGAGYYKRAPHASDRTLQPLVRLDLDLGNDVSPGLDRAPNIALSPDGTQLVYVSQSKLFIRQLDRAYSTELPGTDKAEGPFFSPDGQWVAFTASGRLKKISLRGHDVTAFGDSASFQGGSWAEDGKIVNSVNAFTLSQIPLTGGAPKPLTELRSGEVVHRWPQILPDGKAVLFTAYPSMTGVDGATIEVLSLKDRGRKTLVRGGTFGRYLASGHLTYIDKGTLFAVPFDLDRLEVHGTPTPVLEGVAYSTAWGHAQMDVSRTGTLVYRSSRAGGGLVSLRWLDESGNTSPLLPVPGNYSFPTLSPDGNRLALISAGDIWVYELGRGSMTRLTYGGGCAYPVWTPDGRYIVFHSARAMMWTRADGTGQPQILRQGSNPQNPQSFAPDGRHLAFVEISPSTGADIWILPVESGASALRAGKPEVFLQTPFHERAPMFSPDGRWLAYQSNESGDYRVYVEAFPQKHARQQVSTDGHSYALWSRNGKDLFFLQYRSSQLMAVKYRSRGDSFVTDTPRVWAKKIAWFAATKSYDPAPDGKGVIVLSPAESSQEPQNRLIFLLNFFDELRRRAPVSAN